MQTTQENALNGRLPLCRDSFGNAGLHLFLAEDFREVINTRQMPGVRWSRQREATLSSSRLSSEICRNIQNIHRIWGTKPEPHPLNQYPQEK